MQLIQLKRGTAACSRAASPEGSIVCFAAECFLIRSLNVHSLAQHFRRFPWLSRKLPFLVRLPKPCLTIEAYARHQQIWRHYKTLAKRMLKFDRLSQCWGSEQPKPHHTPCRAAGSCFWQEVNPGIR